MVDRPLIGSLFAGIGGLDVAVESHFGGRLRALGNAVVALRRWHEAKDRDLFAAARSK